LGKVFSAMFHGPNLPISTSEKVNSCIASIFSHEWPGHSWEDFEDLRLLDAVQESNWVNKSFPRLGIITIYFTSGGPHRDIILS
jgi:hypothetical protein